MKKEEEELDVDVKEAMRLYAIDQLTKENDLGPWPFSSLHETDLVEDDYVDEEIDYNEVDLDTFL